MWSKTPVYVAGLDSGVLPNRSLVDVDHLVEVGDALDLAVPTRERLGPVQVLGQRTEQDVVDQGRLPGSGHPGHGHEAPERERHVDVARVVLGAPHGDDVAGPGSPPRRIGIDFFPER